MVKPFLWCCPHLSLTITVMYLPIAHRKTNQKPTKNRVVKYTCFSDFQVYHVNMRKVTFTEPNYVDVISDTFIQKARKNYQDSRTRRNLNRLNDELQDVQRIMVQNIDDVLQRGEQLSGE